MKYFVENRYWNGECNWRIARCFIGNTYYLCIGKPNDEWNSDFYIEEEYFEYMKQNFGAYTRNRSIFFKTEEDAKLALLYVESVIIMEKIIQ